MNYKSLIEFLINSFIPKEDIIQLYTQFSEIEQIISFKSLQKYEHIYFNKKNIHEILYVQEKVIKIPSNILENNINVLFYIILLIKHETSTTNYIYDFNYIKNINNLRNKCKNELNTIILSLIIIELINNYRNADDFYDTKYEKQLELLEKENETIKNNDTIIIKYNLNHEDIKYNNIEEIYIQIIISLIKEEKLKDYDFSSNIFNQLDLQSINLTEKIYNKLLSVFNINNNYIKRYIISNIEDLYDEHKINFYFIILKYIFKSSIYIYYIPLLLNTRNTIIKLLKSDINKFSEFNTINPHLKEKIDFVLKSLFDSDYYYNKYLSSKFVKIKQIIKYYKTFLKKSKKHDIILLEKSINNLDKEIQYEKYYKDLEKAQKLNLRSPLINYILEKDKLNNNDELENAIKNKKIIKIKKSYKEMLNNIFNNNDNKTILLNIFTEDEYNFFINEVNVYPKIYNKIFDENNYYYETTFLKEISQIKDSNLNSTGTMK